MVSRRLLLSEDLSATRPAYGSILALLIVILCAVGLVVFIIWAYHDDRQHDERIVESMESVDESISDEAYFKMMTEKFKQMWEPSFDADFRQSGQNRYVAECSGAIYEGPISWDTQDLGKCAKKNSLRALSFLVRMCRHKLERVERIHVVLEAGDAQRVCRYEVELLPDSSMIDVGSPKVLESLIQAKAKVLVDTASGWHTVLVPATE